MPIFLSKIFHMYVYVYTNFMLNNIVTTFDIFKRKKLKLTETVFGT